MSHFCFVLSIGSEWSASAGIFLWKHQNLVDEAEGFFGVLVNAMVIVSAPMVLHGAYDTLLKKEINSWALLVAGISFLWLVFQIETARRKDPAGESSDADAGLSRYAAPA